MASTLVLDAPTGIGGPGSVRASARGCDAVLPSVLGPKGTGLPWGALLGADLEATGGAMPAGTAVRGTEQQAVVLTGVEGAGVEVIGTAVAAHRRRTAVPATGLTFLVRPFAPTTPYSTLGIHSPGRPPS